MAKGWKKGHKVFVLMFFMSMFWRGRGEPTGCGDSVGGQRHRPPSGGSKRGSPLMKERIEKLLQPYIHQKSQRAVILAKYPQL